MYRPTELRHFLDSLGTSPKKKLSQNFLIDGNIVRKMVSSSDVHPDDVVLEIGPGPGVLTQTLLQAGATVIAVEKDPVLAKALERFQNDNLFVYIDDILQVPLKEILKKTKKTKVIANLPYHITTPVLTHLLPHNELFSSIIVMVQKEVAERFTASPHSKNYSSITIFLQFYSKIEFLFKVSRSCFYPEPKVDSAVIRFDLREPPHDVDPEPFFHMVRCAFGQRRKMLRSSLSHLAPQAVVLEALERSRILPESRPEELSLEQFLLLHQNLKKYRITL